MLRAGDFVERYEVVRRIGRGGFGSVFLVKQASSPNEEFAMKIMDDLIMNDEVKIGLSLGAKCPYLVKFKEVFVRDEGLIVVMEFCGGGDLSKYFEQRESLSDQEVYRFVYEASMAVKTLHDSDIIHRDIKPSNFFLLTNGGFKLGDYGMARALETASAKTLTRVGTDGYIAPEILEGKNYSKKADIFSLGVTFMEFIIGHNPFKNPGGMVNMSMVMKGSVVEAARKNMHPLMQFAHQMIAVNPDARPVIDDVLAFPYPTFLLFGALIGERDAIAKERDEAVKQRDALRAQLVEQSFFKDEHVVEPAKTKTKTLTVGCAAGGGASTSRSSSGGVQSGAGCAWTARGTGIDIFNDYSDNDEDDDDNDDDNDDEDEDDRAATIAASTASIFGAGGGKENGKPVVVKLRPTPVTVTAGISGGVRDVITDTPTGFFFMCGGKSHAVFLDRSFTKGIWKWTVQITCGVSKIPTFYFGIAPSNRITIFDLKRLHSNGACGLHFWEESMNLKGKSQLCGVKSRTGHSGPIMPVPNNASVAMEVDVDACTLCFFVDDRKVPYMITHISKPLHIGMHLEAGNAFSCVSFLSLQTPTSSPVECKVYECGEKVSSAEKEGGKGGKGGKEGKGEKRTGEKKRKKR